MLNTIPFPISVIPLPALADRLRLNLEVLLGGGVTIYAQFFFFAMNFCGFSLNQLNKGMQLSLVLTLVPHFSVQVSP